jgi:hypothetical protein
MLYDHYCMLVKRCLTTKRKPSHHPVSLIALLIVGFACAVTPARTPEQPGDGRQQLKIETSLVLPFDTETLTIGGSEGTVLRVTTLASDGPGSLRSALEDARPRLVVFEVGGIIDLQGRSLDVRHPFLTVAGQTAPDPGITLIRGSLTVETHDVIIEHIAVRPGDRGAEPAHGEWSPDALGSHRGNAGPVHHVVFDHCSATWAIDENLSASGPADVDSVADPDITSHDITLRHCLIAEGLSHATHPKGEHSKGTLIHDGVRNVAITGCLYAHNRERNPRLKGGTTSVVAGNLMYNWGAACVGVGKHGNRQMLQPSETVLVGNVAIAGADTHSRFLVKSVDPGGRVFLRDNVAVAANGTPIAMTDDGVVPMPARDVPVVRPWSAAAEVLRSAGSRPAHRDPIDARIVRSVIDGVGKIIDSQEQVGGYPVRTQTTRVLSVPDGADARRKWLDGLSRALEEDTTIDLSPLWKRLGR